MRVDDVVSIICQALGTGKRASSRSRSRDERKERKRVEREENKVQRDAADEEDAQARQRVSLLCALLAAALYPQIATLHRPPLKVRRCRLTLSSPC